LVWPQYVADYTQRGGSETVDPSVQFKNTSHETAGDPHITPPASPFSSRRPHITTPRVRARSKRAIIGAGS